MFRNLKFMTIVHFKYSPEITKVGFIYFVNNSFPGDNWNEIRVMVMSFSGDSLIVPSSKIIATISEGEIHPW